MRSNNYYKENALRFLQEYDIKDLTYDEIKQILEKQGYDIVLFNSFDENEIVENLLVELQLKEYANANTAFTYKRGNIKLVFLDDSLLESDKLYALVHEEGHIFCGHMDRDYCSGKNVEDEREANEFTHYVFNPPALYSIKKEVINHNKAVKITVIVLLVTALCASTLSIPSVGAFFKHKNYVKTLDYYVTEEGEKYHREDCTVIKGKENIRNITEDEYKSGKYQPCKICKPDE